MCPNYFSTSLCRSASLAQKRCAVSTDRVKLEDEAVEFSNFTRPLEEVGSFLETVEEKTLTSADHGDMLGEVPTRSR